jgi:hypothetical protein
VKPAPRSKKPVQTGDPETDKELRKIQRRPHLSMAERMLKGFFYALCILVATSCIALRELSQVILLTLASVYLFMQSLAVPFAGR